MSEKTTCMMCGYIHEPHCISSHINVYPSGRVVVPIDWERERIAAARAALQGMLSGGGWDAARVAAVAVDYAEKLIAELRKEVQP